VSDKNGFLISLLVINGALIVTATAFVAVRPPRYTIGVAFSTLLMAVVMEMVGTVLIWPRPLPMPADERRVDLVDQEMGNDANGRRARRARVCGLLPPLALAHTSMLDADQLSAVAAVGGPGDQKPPSLVLATMRGCSFASPKNRMSKRSPSGLPSGESSWP